MSRTFRIQYIPPNITESEVKAAINEQFTDADGENIRKFELSLVPSCYTNESKMGLLSFHNGIPKFLRKPKDDKEKEDFPVRFESGLTIHVDSHFLDLTQLFDTPEGVAPEADFVFICGFGGHAYGSWKDKSSPVMWPRDWFREDFKTARVMIFGYAATLVDATQLCLDDFCHRFLDQLKMARDSSKAKYRPLILVSHSYGSKIITKSVPMCKMKFDDEEYRALFSSLKKSIFFGAPHHGMYVDDMKEFLDTNELKSQKQKVMLEELANEGSHSAAVKRELEEFTSLVNEKTFDVITIRETRPERLLTSKDGKLERSGKIRFLLPEGQDTLGLPRDREKVIYSDTSHSEITKFHKKDANYFQLVKEIRSLMHKMKLASVSQGGAAREEVSGEELLVQGADPPRGLLTDGREMEHSSLYDSTEEHEPAYR